jgi:hypothetical protein
MEGKGQHKGMYFILFFCLSEALDEFPPLLLGAFKTFS